MFDAPKTPDYVSQGLEKQKTRDNIKVYTQMLDDILDDYLDGSITKLTMEDMMKWGSDMLNKAKIDRGM